MGYSLVKNRIRQRPAVTNLLLNADFWRKGKDGMFTSQFRRHLMLKYKNLAKATFKNGVTEKNKLCNMSRIIVILRVIWKC